MSEREHGRAAFAFVLVTVMLDMLALGIVIPVLPPLVVQLEGGDTAAAARVVGGFAFAWSLTQFFLAPLLGALSDRFGRRPVILASNVGLSLDYVLMALAPSVPWLFLGRLINGVTSASIPTAFAYIADVTPPAERAAKFGMVNAAFGLGFVVGPAVGGLLGGVDPRLPFWGAAALSFANAAYGFFILPESLPPGRRAPFAWRSASPLAVVGLVRAHPALSGLVLAALSNTLAHESLPSLFVLYTGHRYRWTVGDVGLVLAVFGVMTTVVSVALVGRVARRFGEGAGVAIGLVAGAAGFLTYALAATGRVFLAGLPLMALWQLAAPSMNALMTRRVAPEDQGKLQGALSSLKAITGMVGPVFFTQVFAAAVDAHGAPGAPGAPFAIAAGLVMLALALARSPAGR